ncbi:hypothetical protein BC829DRAFT_370310 [Chytridium lagenaria]|nr:hypothetical protein BC829DRAFT_370310 [Chytridium lagenaria]
MLQQHQHHHQQHHANGSTQPSPTTTHHPHASSATTATTTTATPSSSSFIHHHQYHHRQLPPIGDRITQIQDCLDKLSELFFTSLGVLQRDAPLVPVHPAIPVTSWTEEQVKKNTESNKKFSAEVARDIVRTAKVVDFLIDRLPGIKYTPDQQMEMVNALEKESDMAGEQMESAIVDAEHLLEEVRSAIKLITNDQLDSLKRGDY